MYDSPMCTAIEAAASNFSACGTCGRSGAALRQSPPRRSCDHFLLSQTVLLHGALSPAHGVEPVGRGPDCASTRRRMLAAVLPTGDTAYAAAFVAVAAPKLPAASATLPNATSDALAAGLRGSSTLRGGVDASFVLMSSVGASSISASEDAPRASASSAEGAPARVWQQACCRRARCKTGPPVCSLFALCELSLIHSVQHRRPSALILFILQWMGRLIRVHVDGLLRSYTTSIRVAGLLGFNMDPTRVVGFFIPYHWCSSYPSQHGLDGVALMSLAALAVSVAHHASSLVQQ